MIFHSVQSSPVILITVLFSPGVKALASSCPGLIVVDLTRCRSITDEGVLALAAQCRLLEVISLSGCLGLTSAALLALAQNCKVLHSIYISETRVR